MPKGRIPTHLKLVTGKRVHRADVVSSRNEPKPQGDLRDPPGWMTFDQTIIWSRAMSNAPAGLLKRLDESVFTAWVIACDMHRKAAEQLALNKDLTQTGPTGVVKQSVYVTIINQQAAIMKSLAAELGFSPVSRSRVVMPEGENEKVEDEFFG